IIKIIGSKKTPKYKTYTGRGDIYCLFYERGFKLLKPQGFLTYITSNKWMRAQYGENLRNYFVENTNPISLIDLGEGRFSSATVDTNIITLQKAVNQNNLTAVTYNEDSLDNIAHYIKLNSVKMAFSLNENWAILNPIEVSIKNKIIKNGVPLEKWDIKIDYGIKTGYNDAFIIDEKTRQEIIAKDPKSDEILKPILRGRDIVKNEINFANLYLIATHNGYYDDHHNLITAVNINDYEVVKDHLDKHLEKIAKRSDKGKTPYNLRDCAYMNEFFKPKIVYSEITTDASFVIDHNNYLINQTCYIMTGDHLEYIANTLSSKLFKYVFKNIFSGASLGDDVYRCLKYALIKLPIRPPEGGKAIMTDDEIFDLYELSENEKEYILLKYN
ncbi:MAG: Eco57I restriction-modification methylase domain-containing protein, partial [Christensenellaceae bacterium]|nr:Eco57I restriction-modification methylase domain-containing protein [Christensenellaceae bacterium]